MGCEIEDAGVSKCGFWIAEFGKERIRILDFGLRNGKPKTLDAGANKCGKE
jgi:hypothetical protein